MLWDRNKRGAIFDPLPLIPISLRSNSRERRAQSLLCYRRYILLYKLGGQIQGSKRHGNPTSPTPNLQNGWHSWCARRDYNGADAWINWTFWGPEIWWETGNDNILGKVVWHSNVVWVCITLFATRLPWEMPPREYRRGWEDNWKWWVCTYMRQIESLFNWQWLNGLHLGIHPSSKQNRKLIDHWAKILVIYPRMIPHNSLGRPRVRGCVSTVAECTTITRRYCETDMRDLMWDHDWRLIHDWQMTDILPRWELLYLSLAGCGPSTWMGPDGQSN